MERISYLWQGENSENFMLSEIPRKYMELLVAREVQKKFTAGWTVLAGPRAS